MTKPFLKWAGGKHKLVPTIEALLPASTRLVEPFVGAGSVFMGIERPRYLLGDGNGDLISLYRWLRYGRDDFIAETRELFTPAGLGEPAYKARRARLNRLPVGDRERAALFVYINRFCFNGLCRYNDQGKFNTSWGKNTEVPYFPEGEMLAFADKSERAEFAFQDFRTTLAATMPGDVVYADPPYLGSPVSYGVLGFDEDDQRDLVDCCWDCAARGIPVVLSNADTPLAQELYTGAEVHELLVSRAISRDGDGRKKAAELMVVFSPEAVDLRVAA